MEAFLYNQIPRNLTDVVTEYILSTDDPPRQSIDEFAYSYQLNGEQAATIYLLRQYTSIPGRLARAFKKVQIRSIENVHLKWIKDSLEHTGVCIIQLHRSDASHMVRQTGNAIYNTFSQRATEEGKLMNTSLNIVNTVQKGGFTFSERSHWLSGSFADDTDVYKLWILPMKGRQRGSFIDKCSDIDTSSYNWIQSWLPQDLWSHLCRTYPDAGLQWVDWASGNSKLHIRHTRVQCHQPDFTPHKPVNWKDDTLSDTQDILLHVQFMWDQGHGYPWRIVPGSHMLDSHNISKNTQRAIWDTYALSIPQNTNAPYLVLWANGVWYKEGPDDDEHTAHLLRIHMTLGQNVLTTKQERIQRAYLQTRGFVSPTQSEWPYTHTMSIDQWEWSSPPIIQDQFKQYINHDLTVMKQHLRQVVVKGCEFIYGLYPNDLK